MKKFNNRYTLNFSLDDIMPHIFDNSITIISIFDGIKEAGQVRRTNPLSIKNIEININF